jgi:hypothetical protein
VDALERFVEVRTTGEGRRVTGLAVTTSFGLHSMNAAAIATPTSASPINT